MYSAAYRGGGHNFMKLFRAYDKDSSGTLDFDELRSVLRKDIKMPTAVMSDDAIHRIFHLLDCDGGGHVGIGARASAVRRRRARPPDSLVARHAAAPHSPLLHHHTTPLR
jgi:hypothetical protein